MNTAPLFHPSSLQPNTDNSIVDSISLSTIEAEKRQIQYPDHRYTSPAVSEETIDLEQLTTLLTFLRKSDDLIFQVRCHDSCFQVTANMGWEGLMRGSPAKLAALFQQSARFSIHPYLVHYLNNFGDLDMNAVAGQWFCHGADAGSSAAHLNARVDSLRADLRSPYTTRDVDNHRRGCRSNLASLNGYVSDLFERYSRLLVVRLDLGYRQGLSLNPLMAQYQVAVSTRPEYGAASPHDQSVLRYPHVTVDQIQHHREALLGFIRHTFADDFCGYAWKLEYGARKGYHIHMVLFFNGANLCKDVAIGAHIGNYWNKFITTGRGNYYNCNAKQNNYRHPCVGSQSWNCPDMRRGMEYLCAYLMKPDLYARLELGEGQRTFGRGVSPLRGWVDQPRRGRPRMTETV